MVICRKLDDLALVDRSRGESQQSVIVASDYIDVQQAAAKKPGVSKVCFVEQMETEYDVAKDVLRIRAAINQWMASLVTDGKGVPEELLFFEHMAEGGMTTQRIQDALLLIRSYRSLFSSNDVSRMVLRRHSNNRWEDDVLVQTARSSGIEVDERRSIGYRAGEKLNLVALDRRLLGRVRRVYIPESLAHLLRRARLYVRVVRAKLHAHNRSAEGGGPPQIAFLLGNSSDKQVGNTVPLMEELLRRGSYQPVALCWHAANGAVKMRLQGLQAIELETFFPLSRIWEVWQRVRRTRVRALRRKDELRRDSALSYEGVALGRLMQPSLDHMFRSLVYDRFLLHLAAGRYFGTYRPVAIRTWGGNLLDLGAICRNVVLRMWKTPPLNFSYEIGVDYPDWPYAVYNTDLYFAAYEREKQLLVSQGSDQSSVVVTGQVRYDHLASFQQKYSKHDSRKLLELPPTSKLFAFFALGYPVRGVQSTRELFEVTVRVLEFFNEGTHGTLIIKPHPNDSSNSLNFFGPLRRHSPPSDNIFWYDKGMLPYHCINAADVVITKFSTVGVEAILLGVPLVSIALDGEARFQEIYGNVAEKLTSMEELIALLARLGADTKARREFEDKQSGLRHQYLEQRFASRNGPAAGTMADVLEERLKRRQATAS